MCTSCAESQITWDVALLASEDSAGFELSLSPPLLRCFCHSKIIPQSASFLALCLDFLVWRFAHFLYPSPKVCQDEISR